MSVPADKQVSDLDKQRTYGCGRFRLATIVLHRVHEIRTGAFVATSSRQFAMLRPMQPAYVLDFISLLLCVLGVSQARDQPHICLIGGGVASASTAHFLTSPPLTPTPRITLFEKTDKLGGRVSTLHIRHGNKTTSVEAGASIIAGDNRLMAHFASLLNLSRKEPPGGSLGLWTGTSFAVRTYTDKPLRSMAAFVMRYGLSLLRMRRFVKDMLFRYAKLYPQNGQSWPACVTVEALFERCQGLFNLTQVDFPPVIAEYLSERFAKEMVSAVTRVNYGQDVSQMNGLAGAVALAGSGSDLWAVKGGNAQVIEGLLQLAGVDVLLGTPVVRIQLSENRSASNYSVFTERGKYACDAVVLGVPYELAGIALSKETTSKLNVGRKFHRTHATFVKGFLNTETFGENPPDSVLTVEGANEPFMSVGKQARGDDLNEIPLFKVFSREPLGEAAYRRIFQEGIEIIAEYPWLAYPDFAPPEQFASFDVDPRNGAFIYTSPIESAGSAMEMSAVSGANAAALVKERLGLAHRDDQENAAKEEL